jgi:hypothetical protein
MKKCEIEKVTINAFENEKSFISLQTFHVYLA